MPNPQVQSRFPPELYDRLDAWSDERGIGYSEATRRLVERGLDADQAPGLAEKVALSLAWAALVVAPFGLAYPPMFFVASAYLLAAVVAHLVARGAIDPPNLPLNALRRRSG